jgi:septum formation protein
VPELILASSSPRRVELLNQLNLSFRIVSPDINETKLLGEPHLEYVSRMSREKAESVYTGVAECGDHIVLSGDTVVIVDGDLLGKPIDKNDAVEMLLRLSGNTHQVITSVTVKGNIVKDMVKDMPGETISIDSVLVETNVQFRVLTVDECVSYWNTGEPVDKAGAYGIQGLGAVFVERIEGSYSNVVGLPLSETAQLLSMFGIECLTGHEQKQEETKLVKEVDGHG